MSMISPNKMEKKKTFKEKSDSRKSDSRLALVGSTFLKKSN